MDCQADVAPVREGVAAAEHVIRAVDTDGHNRQPELHRELVGSLVERAHMAGFRARAFGEHDNRHTTLEGLLGLLHRPADCRRGGVVDEDMSGGGAGFPDKRNLAQPDLHHPAEVMVEEAVYRKDVVGTLVVGHEDVGGILVDILPPFHRHSHEGEPAEEHGPDFGGPVAEPARQAEEAPDNRQRGRQNGQHQQDREHNQHLVYAVENQFHLFK